MAPELPASHLPDTGSSARSCTRILIVDDSEDDAFLLSKQLTRAIPHCEFQRVDSAASMREALAQHEWDVVISDHAMPGFDSSEALAILKQSKCAAPIILYSGQIDQAVGLLAMQRGARDYVPKHDPERLIPALRRELDHARLRKEKAAADQSIVKLANYDELTGLPNRTRFRELIVQNLLGGDGRPAHGALLYIDLDRFMRINDSFGYPTGDALIKQVAGRLQSSLGRTDALARLGQDEFGVLSLGINDPATATALADRLLSRFSPAIVENGQEFFVTASMGVSLFPQHGQDEHTLLKNAESAMFAVKKQGRNGFQLYQHALNHDSSQRLRLENSLRHAIERNEFHLLYQPILEMATRRVVGAEALIRWQQPEKGLIPPDQFIPLADETGLIQTIGEWVLKTACAQFAQWHRRGLDWLSVAVNVSAQQFRQEDLAERVASILEDVGIDPHRVALEITETVAMQDAKTTIATLKRFKDMGMTISIDDFGTGYSSLAYLKRFPIDTLKIDRSFVRDILIDADDCAIVDAVMSLGRALDLRVVAEGVETDEQFDYLLRRGCDRMQGFLFSQPIPPEEFLKLIERQAREAKAAQGGGVLIPALN
ncbi:MAG: EAL domain-containing protein [Nevskia sp.]|nr:EAL domain-containing protein [Nevskia sp.]